jgi:hypothetical protein
VQPSLSPPFLESPTWTKLSAAAQAALRGLLPFAIRRDCDWSVEGKPQEIATNIGPGEGLTPAAIVIGLRELEAVGCVRRYTSAMSSAKFVLRVPLDEGPRMLTPVQKPAEEASSRAAAAKRRKRV